MCKGRFGSRSRKQARRLTLPMFLALTRPLVRSLLIRSSPRRCQCARAGPNVEVWPPPDGGLRRQRRGKDRLHPHSQECLPSARTEQTLGNVTAGIAPNRPVVAIRYRVGADPAAREWTGAGEDEFIERVSVFDTQCASVYLTEKTDVAFRPFGLDLFDKLVQACKAVRARLEAEQRTLTGSATVGLVSMVPEGTAVAKLLGNLTVLTKTEAVTALATLSDDDTARLALLEKQLYISRLPIPPSWPSSCDCAQLASKSFPARSPP